MFSADIGEVARAELLTTSAPTSWDDRCEAEEEHWERKRNQRFESHFSAKAVPLAG